VPPPFCLRFRVTSLTVDWSRQVHINLDNKNCMNLSTSYKDCKMDKAFELGIFLGSLLTVPEPGWCSHVTTIMKQESHSHCGHVKDFGPFLTGLRSLDQVSGFLLSKTHVTCEDHPYEQ